MRRKKSKKKIIVLTLSAILFLSVAYASFNTNINLKVKGNIKETDENCFTITDNGDGTGTITEYDKTCGSVVKLPNYINNLKITKIADGDASNGVHGPFVNKGIKKLIISNVLTRIGGYSFCNNTINFLNIPSNVKEIGGHAFAWYGSFSNGLILNEGLETIGVGAFESNNLTSLKIPSTVKNLYVTIASGNLIEGDEAFIYAKDENGNTDYTYLVSYGNRNIEEITIPSNIKTIGMASFVSDVGIKTVNITDNVTTIKAQAFWNMHSLTTVNIGSGVTAIDSSAFYQNANLKIININKKEGELPYAPWGANATVNYLK